jgi:hypothetical protein
MEVEMMPARPSLSPAQPPSFPITAEEEKERPHLSLATALPLSVWQGHLVPSLLVVEAARLRAVCSALKGVVNECPMRLRMMTQYYLPRALACFPSLESLELAIVHDLEGAEEPKVLELVLQHGGNFRSVRPIGEAAERVVWSAVRSGALPRLTFYDLRFDKPDSVALLRDEKLGSVEWMEVMAYPLRAEDLAALGRLRDLQHLRTLFLNYAPAEESTVPPFIPPSLKWLYLSAAPVNQLESILRQLPPLLTRSGAALEQVEVGPIMGMSAEGGDALGRVLRTCSRSVKSISLQWASGNRDDAAGTNACLPGVMSGLRSCHEGLERLSLPFTIFKTFSPSFNSFTRLTKLSLHGGEIVDFTSPVWGLVANGLLPKLAALEIRAILGVTWWSVEEESSSASKFKFTRALEAVAGTLRELSFEQSLPQLDVPEAACYLVSMHMAAPQSENKDSCELSA